MIIGPELKQLLESKSLWAFERKEKLIYGDTPTTVNGCVQYPIIGTYVEYSIGVLRGEAQVRWCKSKDPTDFPLMVSNAPGV